MRPLGARRVLHLSYVCVKSAVSLVSCTHFSVMGISHWIGFQFCLVFLSFLLIVTTSQSAASVFRQHRPSQLNRQHYHNWLQQTDDEDLYREFSDAASGDGGIDEDDKEDQSGDHDDGEEAPTTPQVVNNKHIPLAHFTTGKPKINSLFTFFYLSFSTMFRSTGNLAALLLKLLFFHNILPSSCL